MKKKNNLVRNLLITGVAIGGSWLLWSKLIKPRFFPGTKEEEEEKEEAPQAPTKELPEAPTKEIDKPTSFDIDKKIKFGDKGEGVYKVQTAINAIAKLRGDSSYFDKSENTSVSFPLPTNIKSSEFAKRTRSGARYAFGDFYKNNGYITVRKAREQWARTAGYYGKDFPFQLVGTSNEADLKKIYDANKGKMGYASQAVVNILNP